MKPNYLVGILAAAAPYKERTSRPERRRFRRLGVLGIATFALVLVAATFAFFNSKPDLAKEKRIQAYAETNQLCATLQAYWTDYGTLPSGSNAMIMFALNGANPRGIVYSNFKNTNGRFNARGDYLDPWGTPYLFDTSNPVQPWAYSAGENTRDDGSTAGSDDVPIAAIGVAIVNSTSKAVASVNIYDQLGTQTVTVKDLPPSSTRDATFAARRLCIYSFSVVFADGSTLTGNSQVVSPGDRVTHRITDKEITAKVDRFLR